MKILIKNCNISNILGDYHVLEEFIPIPQCLE